MTSWYNAVEHASLENEAFKGDQALHGTSLYDIKENDSLNVYTIATAIVRERERVEPLWHIDSLVLGHLIANFKLKALYDKR